MFIEVKSPSTGKVRARFDPSRLLLELDERKDVFEGGRRKGSKHVTTVVDLTQYLQDKESRDRVIQLLQQL